VRSAAAVTERWRPAAVAAPNPDSRPSHRPLFAGGSPRAIGFGGLARSGAGAAPACDRPSPISTLAIGALELPPGDVHQLQELLQSAASRAAGGAAELQRNWHRTPLLAEDWPHPGIVAPVARRLGVGIQLDPGFQPSSTTTT